MSISEIARTHPDKAAAILAETGESLTYRELDATSRALAGYLLDQGLRAGDRVAIIMGNSLSCFVAVWAARRAGLRYVPINWHLAASEARYIIENSDSRALFCEPQTLALARDAMEKSTAEPLRTAVVFGEAEPGFVSARDIVDGHVPIANPDERDGIFMFYSSGTTGYPKGILRPLPDQPFGVPSWVEETLADAFGFAADTIYLCPAPLYHAAPMGWSMTCQQYGGTVILMGTFDAEPALAAMERYQVSLAQFVPTHFVRMLRLSAAVRQSYDLSSLKRAVHSAAPIAIDVKQRMIDWWGPIVDEYYAGSEGAGMTRIDATEWLSHPGSVGRADLAGIRIVREDGELAATGEIGAIYFENAPRFDYHRAPDQTAEFFNDQGWGTFGDMGWVDGDGYLYLADRKSHMIISGGVNIYPQEIENLLMTHPDVMDVAVIGVPDVEFGEAVKAVVIAAPGRASPQLAEDLRAFARGDLAGFKVPRTIDFVERLPRLESGKLLKRELRAKYWSDDRVRI